MKQLQQLVPEYLSNLNLTFNKENGYWERKGDLSINGCFSVDAKVLVFGKLVLNGDVQISVLVCDHLEVNGDLIIPTLLQTQSAIITGDFYAKGVIKSPMLNVGGDMHFLGGDLQTNTPFSVVFPKN